MLCAYTSNPPEHFSEYTFTFVLLMRIPIDSIFHMMLKTSSIGVLWSDLFCDLFRRKWAPISGAITLKRHTGLSRSRQSHPWNMEPTSWLDPLLKIRLIQKRNQNRSLKSGVGAPENIKITKGSFAFRGNGDCRGPTRMLEPYWPNHRLHKKSLSWSVTSLIVWNRPIGTFIEHRSMSVSARLKTFLLRLIFTEFAASSNATTSS